MDELRFFCLDSRVRDQGGECQVVHFCRNLDDESVLVIDTFRPYAYVTSPFGEADYERLRERILELDPDASVEKTEFARGSGTLVAAKASVRTREAYYALRDKLRQRPEHFLELFPRARLVKRYLLERDLVPLTVWQAEATPFPHDARVPAYLASSIEQNDTLTYENPSCESLSIVPESLAHALVASKDPIRTMIFSTGALSWDRGIVQRSGARYVDSEIDLLEATRRQIIAKRPVILAGFRSDTVDFPRILARVSAYNETKHRVDFSISDDFSLPYRMYHGVSIIGMIHMDVAKAASIVSELAGYEDLERLLSSASLEIHDEETQLIEGQRRLAKLTRSAAEKLYPLFAELSKLCREQVFDVSRQPVWRTYESYVDTYCLTHGLCYESHSPDEAYGNAPSADMIEDETVVATSGVRVPHLRAYLARQHNVSRESLRESRPGDGTGASFTDERSGPIDALSALLATQERLRSAAQGYADAPITARLRAYELLATGFEQAIGNRASTLYFPEGASYLRRREHEALGRAGRHVSAIVDHYIFTDDPQELDERLSALGIHHEALDLERALVMREPFGAIMISTAHAFDTAGKARLDRTVPPYVVFTHDIVARKILLGADPEDVEDYVRERIRALVDGDVNEEELVSQVTMHRPLAEYELELFFVQAARELEARGFLVEKGTTIPYVVVEDHGELRGAAPGGEHPLAYHYYAESKLRPVISPLLVAAGIEEHRDE